MIAPHGCIAAQQAQTASPGAGFAIRAWRVAGTARPLSGRLPVRSSQWGGGRVAGAGAPDRVAGRGAAAPRSGQVGRMDSQGGILHCLAGIHVTPGLFLAAFVACGVFLLALWVYRQSDFYGRGFFLLSQAAMLWWLACALLEIAVSGPQCKIFFAKACWPAIGLLPAAWALFNRRYAHSIDAPVAGWERLAVLAGPLLLSAAAFTNGWHGLFYAAGTGPLSDAPGAPVRYVHGPLFYLGALCLYGFLSWSVVTVARGAFAAPRLHRLRFLTLLAITCLAIGANLGYILFGFTLLGFDPTPFSFLSISLLFCWLIISDEFFSILPAGNRALLERLDDPVLFLDRRGRLVEANPAARRLSTDSAARQSLARFRCPEVEALVREMLQGADLRVLPELLDVGARHYQVTASALEKPLGGGETGGWMLLLKDITRVRQQALALEQALRLSERRLEAITEMHRALKSQVDVDPLTGLLNRRGLDAVLERLGPEAPARAGGDRHRPLQADQRQPWPRGGRRGAARLLRLPARAVRPWRHAVPHRRRGIRAGDARHQPRRGAPACGGCAPGPCRNGIRRRPDAAAGELLGRAGRLGPGRRELRRGLRPRRHAALRGEIGRPQPFGAQRPRARLMSSPTPRRRVFPSRQNSLADALANPGTGCIRPLYRGGVAEWSKAHAWKVCRRGTVSRVRIPVPPPYPATECVQGPTGAFCLSGPGRDAGRPCGRPRRAAGGHARAAVDQSATIASMLISIS